MTQVLSLTCGSPEQLPEIARQLLDFAGENKVLLFDAPMGAGKTTLIKAICQTLGSLDHFSSPTFSIVNEYSFSEGKIYHMDLYRTKSEFELMDIGIEEYLYSGDYCLIEWPDNLGKLLEPPYIKIEIEQEENIRYFRATKF